MEKVISEIVIGVIFLALLVSVIPIYRTNRELVADMAEQADYNEKIREITKPDLRNGKEISGSEVIGAIRFYALSDNAELTVTGGGKQHIYKGTGYDENVFTVRRDKNYYVFDYSRNGKVIYIFAEGV